MPSGQPGRGAPETSTLAPPLSSSHSGEKSTISHRICAPEKFAGIIGRVRWCPRLARACAVAAAARSCAAAAAGEGARGPSPPTASSASSRSVRSISLPDGGGGKDAYPPRARSRAEAPPAAPGRRVAAAAFASEEMVPFPSSFASPSSSSSSSPSSSSSSAPPSSSSERASQRTGRDASAPRRSADSRLRCPRAAIARWPLSSALMSRSRRESCPCASSAVARATRARDRCRSATRDSSSRAVRAPSSKLPGTTGDAARAGGGVKRPPPPSGAFASASPAVDEAPREGARGGARSTTSAAAPDAGKDVPTAGPAAAAAAAGPTGAPAA